MFVAVVLSVMAGLLAMHALSSGHSGHASAAAGQHVHTGEHHDDTDQGGEEPGNAVAGPAIVLAEGPAVPAGVPVASWGRQALAPAVGDGTMVGPGKNQDEQVGHGLCPGSRPGHCPALPSLASMCQAVLSGASVMVLLLLLLMLAVLVAGPALVSPWRTALTPAGHDRWHHRRYRLRLINPSLHELCISRI